MNEEVSNLLHSIYPKSIGANHKNYIAFSNTRSPVGVILIDYNGNYIGQYGEEGKGPDEVLSVTHKGFDRDDNIVIRDKSLALIKKFNPNGNLIDTYNDIIKEGIDITSRNLEQCENKWYLSINNFNGSGINSNTLIGVFDEEFEFISAFGDYDPFFNNNKSVLKEPIINVDCENGLIYSTHYKVPYIQVYNIETEELVIRIDNKPSYFNLSEEFIPFVGDRTHYHNFLVEEQSTSSFITSNNEYIIHAFRNATAEYFESRDLKDFNYFVAVYSKKDNSFIGETEVNGIPLGWTKEGYIITLFNNDPDDFQFQLLEVGTGKIEG